MNEQILDTLANVAITLAAFSGLVIAFRVRGAQTWSATEIRVLWFLIVDSFLVSFLLGSWFFVGDLLALWGERRDRVAQEWINYVLALVMGVVLWFSVFDFVVPRGQGTYVVGLMVLLAFAAVEFLFFIGLMLKQDRDL